MKDIIKAGAVLIGAFVCAFVGGAFALAQFIPPPPVLSGNGDSSFSSTDRKKLDAIYWNVKAVKAKLFPKVEDGNRYSDLENSN